MASVLKSSISCGAWSSDDVGFAGEARVFGVLLLFLALFDFEDVQGALVAGEQVLAVVGREEALQRLDAADDEDEVVLAAEREYGVDQIVPHAFVAQCDLQAIGEETEATSASDSRIRTLGRRHDLEIRSRIGPGSIRRR